MMKEKQLMSDIINAHKPKGIKYEFLIKDEKVLNQLKEEGYDLGELSTINDEELVQAALLADTIDSFDRSIIKKATQPSLVGDGIIISKKLISKADKKLIRIDISKFELRNTQFIGIKFVYEMFDILEIFIYI